MIVELAVFGTTALVGAGPLAAVAVGSRAERREDIPDGYDDVDYAWLQNVVMTPESVPMPEARRLVITNAEYHHLNDTRQLTRVL